MGLCDTNAHGNICSGDFSYSPASSAIVHCATLCVGVCGTTDLQRVLLIQLAHSAGSSVSWNSCFCAGRSRLLCNKLGLTLRSSSRFPHRMQENFNWRSLVSQSVSQSLVDGRDSDLCIQFTPPVICCARPSVLENVARALSTRLWPPD